MDIMSISATLKSIELTWKFAKIVNSVSKNIETQTIKLELQENIASLLSELNNVQLGYLEFRVSG